MPPPAPRISNTHVLLGGIICSQILHPSAACRVGGGGVPLAGNLWRNIPHSSVGKESACNAGDLGWIPGLGRSPGEGTGYPLQYSGLENSTDCIVHGVTKSRTQLSNFHFHASQCSAYSAPTRGACQPSAPMDSNSWESIRKTATNDFLFLSHLSLFTLCSHFHCIMHLCSDAFK